MNKLSFFRTHLTQKLTLLTLLGFLFLSPLVSAEMKGFEDFNGNPQVIENYTGKGKWLVVMLWASDCYICNREAHQYVDFHLVHADKDATVLGISLDGQSRKKKQRHLLKNILSISPILSPNLNMFLLFIKTLRDSFLRVPPPFLFIHQRVS